MPQTPNEWLDYAGPASVDTTVSKTGIKWNSSQQAGVITKTNTQLIIPSFNDQNFSTQNNQRLGLGAFNYCTRQFNYTAIEPFTLVDVYSQPNQDFFLHKWNFCYPVIRFRTGINVTRYTINSIWYSFYVSNGFIQPSNWPLYSGQVIPTQFVIEIWFVNQTSAPGFPVQLLQDMWLATSLLNVDAVVGQLPTTLTISDNLDHSRLYTSIAATIPLPFRWYAGVYWNSN